MSNTKTVIRVPMVICVVCRDGERADVMPHIPFKFTQDEVDTIVKGNPNFLRIAGEHEVRSAIAFEELKGRKAIKGTEKPRAVESQDEEDAKPGPSDPPSPNVTSHPDVTERELPERDALETMTVQELNAIVASRDDIVAPNRANKAQLVEAIDGVRAEQDRDQDSL